eukprot:gnl/TRDRNA2_/TRDRNA2_175453_c0_seq1.p1 gnl/TRDRNA2_/TRDRNA2_175453_c0~~gnl/TRDRNA2_/TRDRNA2_175453_c0_seq1.p1  ORF type:complete len:336 (-),score=40.28 gnl/TRDRNA2_/TRDRNA2_175453_c0_seq1:282-1289(-)
MSQVMPSSTREHADTRAMCFSNLSDIITRSEVLAITAAMPTQSPHESACSNTITIDNSAECRDLLGVADIHELLGSGSFGDVYRCTIAGVDEQIALKVLKTQVPPEMNREVNIMGQLCHPNLVSLLGVRQIIPYCLVLELCSGGSLHQLVHVKEIREQFPSLWTQHWARAVYDVACALEYLHQRDIVHRDVKAGNCFLSVPARPGFELPVVKLGDLGFARELASIMTLGVGTIRYMAPEVSNSGAYGLPADIFSCGMLLYEVLTGKVPFAHKRNPAHIHYAICHGRRPSLRCLEDDGIKQYFADIVDECWNHDPAERLTTEDLVMLLHHGVTHQL